MKRDAIKPIHQFGPPVGKFNADSHISETFARIRRQQREQKATQPSKVAHLRNAK